ncbi:hypothetical protein Trydic_g9810 [Trypoxylus dichotomus]
MKVQYHSYQLTEEKPLKVVIRGHHRGGSGPRSGEPRIPAHIMQRDVDEERRGKEDLETHLRASNRLSLPNFRVYRTDREDARGGGTAIPIKSTIEHYPDLALDLINTEATAVTVNLAALGGRSISDLRHPVILAGDLNAKHPSWNSRGTNASGICLRRVPSTTEPSSPGSPRPDTGEEPAPKTVTENVKPG